MRMNVLEMKTEGLLYLFVCFCFAHPYSETDLRNPAGKTPPFKGILDSDSCHTTFSPFSLFFLLNHSLIHVGYYIYI